MNTLPLSLPAWAAAAVAALIVGLSKAGFGAGAGIVAVPLLTLATGGATDMLAVMLPVLICGDIFSIVHYRGKKNWPLLGVLLIGSVIGISGGWVVLHLLGDIDSAIGGNPDLSGEVVLNKLVGGICVTFITIQMWRFFWKENPGNTAHPPYRPPAGHSIGVGAAAGLTSTLSHSAGPIITTFMLPQKLDKSVFVGTVVTYFFVGNLIKLLPFTAQGMFTWPRLATALILFPFAAFGTVLGLFLNRKIKGDHFIIVLYIITLVMGIRLLTS